MSFESFDSFYILLKEKYGNCKRRDNFYSISSYNSKKEELLQPGALLRLLRKSKTADQGELLLERIDCDRSIDIQINCRRDDVSKVFGELLHYLRAIPSLKERLEVFEDKDWLNLGEKLKPGDPVYVKIKDEQVEGVLMFKDNIPEAEGIIFGVKLNESKGTSDGVYKDVRYFDTPRNHAVFTPLNKIQTRRDGWSKKSRQRADAEGEGLYTPEEPNSLLKLGERVVWISDDGPKKGTVRWCGVLRGDQSDNITVGVEFDEPVGTGTGKYKDERLFYTRRYYASLIPVMGLMREDEYNEDPYNDRSPQFKDIANSGELLKQQEHLMERFEKEHILSSYPDVTKRNEGSLPVKTQKSSLPAQFHAECAVDDYRPLHVPLEQIDGVQKSRHKEENNSSSNSSLKSSRSEQDLKLQDPVEVKLKEPLYGIIRWIGMIDGKKIAGLEMEKELSAGTDGTYGGKRYFSCPPQKAFFVPLYKCTKDRRSPVGERRQEFGGQPTPDVEGDIPPAEINSEKDFKEICGKNRGIQGHHNSCYLDATLFSMFYFTTVFDFIFNRPYNKDDLKEYPKVQKVLREGIVNPLRQYHYVRADKVLQLRELLDKLGTVPGMMGEEKDPEEFLNALLSQIMKADPLLHLSSGEHSFFYQLFMEKDENLLLPTTQKLVELSFLQGNVKLKEVPSCLMIQMPRFGKDYKMFHRIVPSLQLDITHILENRPRDCIVCGGLAVFECTDCYQVHGPGLNTTSLCDNCVKKSHQHMNRRNHKPQHLTISDDFLAHYEEIKNIAMAQNMPNGGSVDFVDNPVTFPPEIMELFAVICIQTSHYVSFVKCGSGKDAPWVFFDSMADRMGEQGGYNIPEVVQVPEVSSWLAEKNLPSLLKSRDDKELPEHLRRLLCDGYMCMYQSPTVMMFQ